MGQVSFSVPSSGRKAADIHEIGHAMGRETAFYDNSTPVPFDLTRYSSAGTLHWTGSGTPDYFSLDGGKTDLANFDTTSDYSDFAVDNLTPADPFDFEVDGSVTSIDLEVMNVIGFETPLGSTASITLLGQYAASHFIAANDPAVPVAARPA
jgi:hypothetical protein